MDGRLSQRITFFLPAYLALLLIQLMDIFCAEEAGANTQLDIEDVMEMIKVPLLRDSGTYDYRNGSIGLSGTYLSCHRDYPLILGKAPKRPLR